MKISRIIILVLVIVVIAIVGLYALTGPLAPTAACTSTSWNCAEGYPLQVGGAFGVAGQQCVSNKTNVYCIGGQDANGGPRNEVYYSSSASSSSGNITSWTLDSNQYPQTINGQSCVIYSDIAYCVGGTYNDNGDDVASSYYAQIGNVGPVGNWSLTTAYPIPIDSQSCVASSAYIYCVGGSNETDGSNADAASSNSVWYAQLSSSGVGSWTSSTAYPGNIYFPSCFGQRLHILPGGC